MLDLKACLQRVDLRDIDATLRGVPTRRMVSMAATKMAMAARRVSDETDVLSVG